MKTKAKAGIAPEELRDLRARFLALEGDALIEIHGWLLGVACAVERQRGVDPRDANRLIAELRASKGPPDYVIPVMCPKCDWPAISCACALKPRATPSPPKEAD